jgi:PTH2 family peptidyl-tRNA hydrolase
MIKQVIVMRTDLGMRKGKMAAQAAHASMMFLAKQFRNSSASYFNTVHHPTGNLHGYGISISDEQLKWMQELFTKIVVGCDSELDLLRIIDAAKAEGLTVNHVVDSGKTEFGGVPTLTCAALGPHEAERIDGITGKLKLL